MYMRRKPSGSEDGYPDSTNMNSSVDSVEATEFSEGIYPAVVQTVTETAVELRLYRNGSEKQIIVSKARLPPKIISPQREIEVQLRAESIIKARVSSRDSWKRI